MTFHGDKMKKLIIVMILGVLLLVPVSCAPAATGIAVTVYEGMFGANGPLLLPGQT